MLIDTKTVELDALKAQVAAIDELEAGRNALAAFQQDAEAAVLAYNNFLAGAHTTLKGELEAAQSALEAETAGT